MSDGKNVNIDEEIIAVITAAVAAMETRPDYRLVVRSMRQIPQSSPVWNAAGRLERLSRDLNA
ncbi:MAG TPA: sodium pump decarboxylase subunit gamma [Clostridiales bacterium]|nr:sodium pump decarboxylase subunit gamma [Clostridiales bacterium]HPV01951.1 sodium pump decarboxylase subunit gamma [Clostridiales bacterium]